MAQVQVIFTAEIHITIDKNVKNNVTQAIKQLNSQVKARGGWLLTSYDF
jgi:hypothetical protein